MATVINTTFQLRRGNASVWAKNNPILARGEPGFIIDENRLKIGDGTTAWNDLDYIGEENVFNGATSNDFPSVGKTYVIYKAEEEKALYQWNSTTSTYELLSFSDIEVATEDKIGGVISSNSEKENSVAVDASGAMTVNSLNVNKLVQTENEYLVLYGGSAVDNI